MRGGGRGWPKRLAVMRELPARRMESAKRERVKVDSGSLIHVERNAYSVNSRLIGEQVEARLYLDHVEVWYGQRKVEDLPRLRGRSKHRVDYRHIIEWLVRKPGAFENYRYQEDLFPTSRFRMAYDALKETTPSRSSKEYLKILKLAAEEGEVQVDEALRELLEGKAEVVITVESIARVLAKLDTIPPVTMVEVAPVDLASFDQLCRRWRCGNERGRRCMPGADRAPEGSAPADGAGVLRRDGAAGGTRDAEL